MARRRTYLASIFPVALFLAAMASVDGGSDSLRPSADPVSVASAAEPQIRTAALRAADRVQFIPLSNATCGDTQSCYDAQVKRLQGAALY